MAQTDNKVCDINCLDCRYFYGSFDYELCCNYLLETDKRRPCPPGTGCTVKKKSRRKQLPKKFRKGRTDIKQQSKQELVFKNCIQCGREFLATRHDKKYCDSVCCAIANNRKTLEKIKAERGPIYKRCIQCGKEFLLVKPGQKYCNEECKRKRKEIDHVKD